MIELEETDQTRKLLLDKPYEVTAQVVKEVLIQVTNQESQFHGIKSFYNLINNNKSILSTSFLEEEFIGIAHNILSCTTQEVMTYVLKILTISASISPQHFEITCRCISCQQLVECILDPKFNVYVRIELLKLFEQYIIYYEPKISLPFAHIIFQIICHTIQSTNIEHNCYLHLVGAAFGCCLTFAKKNTALDTFLKEYNLYVEINKFLTQKCTTLKLNLLRLITEAYKQNVEFDKFNIPYNIELMKHRILSIQISAINCVKVFIEKNGDKIRLISDQLIESIDFCMSNRFKSQIYCVSLIYTLVASSDYVNTQAFVLELIKRGIGHSILTLLQSGANSIRLLELLNKILFVLEACGNMELYAEFIQQMDSDETLAELVDSPDVYVAEKAVLLNDKIDSFLTLISQSQ